MTNATLYQLAGVREALDKVIAENEGEIDAAMEAALDQVNGSFDDKVERVALYVKELHGLAKMMKEEEDRISERRQAVTKDASRLVAYLQTQMERVGKAKVNGLLCTVSLQKNPPSVVPVVTMDEPELRNIATFNPRYVRHDETWALDRKAILEDYKAGTLPEDIAKRVQITQSTSLRIR